MIRPSTQDESEAPAFCPRCRLARPAGSPLCAECGERLETQGYCGVCERFWPLRPGSACPKHEIPLDEAQAEPPRPEFIDWATVAAFPHPIEAQAARIRLEAEGIPTFLEGERVGSHGVYQVAIGGVRLQVPSDLTHEARILLSQTWTPPGDEDDLDDAWDELAPEPGARRRAVMRAAIVLFLLMPALGGLIRLLTGG